MKTIITLLVGLIFSNFALAQNVRTRDVFLCSQVVDLNSLKSAKNLADFAKKFTSTSNSRKIRTWNMESHVLTVFSGGSFKTVISIDGSNDFSLLKSGSSLGKPKSGFVAYDLGADEGLADQWGMEALVDIKFNNYITNQSTNSEGSGKLILRSGSEEGKAWDVEFLCEFRESGVWRDAER